MDNSSSAVRNDQASRLRELTKSIDAKEIQSQPPKSKLNIVPRLDPRVVLISEFPVIHGGHLLAWHLAQQFSLQDKRTAIIDLAPAGSRLPSLLQSLKNKQADEAVSARQPLWSESQHGRNLASWRASRPGQIDIVAQPIGEFPGVEQMPRICEQLLRALGRLQRPATAGEATWNTLIVLSEPQGIPLDSACWRAADEVLLLIPKSEAFRDQARAAFTARVPNRSSAQRLIALWKHRNSLPIWRANRTRLATVHAGHPQVPEMENLQWPWPPEASFNQATTRGNRSIATNAKLLARTLSGGTPSR